MICGTGTALPEHRYGQHELAAAAQQFLPSLGRSADEVERFFARTGVQQRCFVLPLDRYGTLSGLGARNAAYLSAAVPLASAALCGALQDAGVAASALDALFTTTVTGIAVPSLDARLMNRLELAPALKRTPLFGLGCVAGASAIARAADYLRAYPDESAALVSVELCSLTFQREDASLANVISSGLFGDGAAAVVLAGAEHPAAAGGVRVLGSLARFFPNTERVMGWDVVDNGFKVVLSPAVPEIARHGLPVLVDELLAQHGLHRDQVAFWIAHPGGPAVIRAMCQGLGVPEGALEPTRRALADVGNLSSASVLFLLEQFRKEIRPERGSYGVLMAMGPAFCAEAVLLQW
jgi:alkylresorcinol/alkylpyrone synthase